MKKTTIVTDCGHQYNTAYDATKLRGATTDCRICTTLLIFPAETTIGTCVRGRDFRVWMHEQDSLWPLNGNGTYYVEF